MAHCRGPADSGTYPPAGAGPGALFWRSVPSRRRVAARRRCPNPGPAVGQEGRRGRIGDTGAGEDDRTLTGRGQIEEQQAAGISPRGSPAVRRRAWRGCGHRVGERWPLDRLVPRQGPAQDRFRVRLVQREHVRASADNKPLAVGREEDPPAARQVEQFPGEARSQILNPVVTSRLPSGVKATGFIFSS